MFTGFVNGMGGPRQEALNARALEMWSLIKSRFNTSDTTLRDWASTMFGGFVQGMADKAADLNTRAQSMWNTVVENRFQNSRGTFQGWASNMFGGFVQGMADKAADLNTRAQSMWNTVVENRFGTPWTTFQTLSTGMINGFVQGINARYSYLNDWASSAWSTVEGRFSTPGSTFTSWASSAMTAFGTGISNSVAGLTGTVTAFFNSIGSMGTYGSWLAPIGIWVTNIGLAFRDKMSEILNNYWGGFQEALRNLRDWLQNNLGISLGTSSVKAGAAVGKTLVDGLAAGIRTATPNALSAASDMAKGVMGIANNMQFAPGMAMASARAGMSSGNVMRPSIVNNATYNVSYQTMQSAGSVQQDVELLNLLYGGRL